LLELLLSTSRLLKIRGCRECRAPDAPAAENLLGAIRGLQDETGVHLEIRAVTEAA
jgi:hypothetical protein